MNTTHWDDIDFDDFLHRYWQRGFVLTRKKVALANLVWQGLATGDLHLEEAKHRLADALSDTSKERRQLLRLFEEFVHVENDEVEDQPTGTDLPQKGIRPSYSLLAFTLVVILLLPLIFYPVPAVWFSEGLLIIGAVLLLLYRRRQGSARKKKMMDDPTDDWPYIAVKQEEKVAPFNFDQVLPFPLYRLMDRPKPHLVHQTIKATSAINNLYKIDIPKTIKATVLNAGMVKVHYQPYKQEASYLLLFDNALRNTHFLEWFHYIHDLLLMEGVHVERFTFDYDPRFCRNAQGQHVQLVDWFSNQRLIVFSTGESMIDVRSGRFFTWVYQIDELWVQKAMLTPRSIAEWGAAEEVLRHSFFVAPGTLEGLIGAIDYLNMDNLSLKDYFEQYLEKRNTYKYLNTHDIGVLISELPEAVFDWVCACAIYPRLNWKMTLFLGSKLEEMPGALINRENLTMLYQLKWFEQGKIPDQHRQLLLSLLPREIELKLRKELLSLIESSLYHLPENSFAYDEGVHLLLRNRYELAHPEFTVERKDLITQLHDQIEKNGTSDQELIDYVKNHTVN